MSHLTPDEATARLSDAVNLWRVRYVSPGIVIDAATDCLVAGVDSPTLRELAGASAGESEFVMGPLIAETLSELGIDSDQSSSPVRAALTTMLRRLTAGQLEPRELAGWAHKYIGHDGDDDLQMFVELDDMYDTCDYSSWGADQLDEWAREEANAFLEGRPSPGNAKEAWRPTDSPAQPSGWLKRLRERFKGA